MTDTGKMTRGLLLLGWLDDNGMHGKTVMTKRSGNVIGMATFTPAGDPSLGQAVINVGIYLDTGNGNTRLTGSCIFDTDYGPEEIDDFFSESLEDLNAGNKTS